MPHPHLISHLKGSGCSLILLDFIGRYTLSSLFIDYDLSWPSIAIDEEHGEDNSPSEPNGVIGGDVHFMHSTAKMEHNRATRYAIVQSSTKSTSTAC